MEILVKLLEEAKRQLVCPLHRRKLQLDPHLYSAQGVPWPEGQMKCPQGCVFPVDGGIPRFVMRDTYASSFGLQWQRWQKTQLDSYTGQSYSRQRLERCLGMHLEELNGKAVLECGSGAGRFTELLIDNCELLVAQDLSDAVDANLKNCAGRRPYMLCQADINASPLPDRFFDVVICLGVIQHTPSSEETIANLTRTLKPGGLLVIDHYTRRSAFSVVADHLTMAYPIRAILRRLNPKLSLTITLKLTAICDPIRKRTCKVRWFDRIASRIFPSACYYNTYPLLKPHVIYEWNELDTYDELTDYHKNFRTIEEIRRYLAGLGFRDIRYQMGGKHIEVRAICS